MGVAHGAWVTVPPPCASRPVGVVEHFDREAKLEQSVSLVDAAHAGADDYGVIVAEHHSEQVWLNDCRIELAGRVGDVLTSFSRGLSSLKDG